MVQGDHQFTGIVLVIAKGVFDLGVFAFGVGEVVIAHGKRAVAVYDGAFIFPPDIGPGLDRKTGILGTFLADEIGQRLIESAAELVLRGKSGLEQHRLAIFIGVECVDVVGCRLGNVTAFGGNLADIDDAFTPCLLCCSDFFSSNGTAGFATGSGGCFGLEGGSVFLSL